ncbi:hypothetical protein LEP1GSC185_1734 [Leptospira licerasiae serovar Varillal str. VAR 010]|uniref:Uncharacterized protein n=1 Tax=Leptospira licerasiae str. MMD4847 TaxID=1049971 RepID=A0ABN0H605_9LEPT|nr:hypothetical protein LEP1GSC185_1734 [Leptospira licerasiae serovar Varillal str. VAR 010]EJZ40981.1 hypothetical protein LEP1GSC178_0998 [Leptospira licerasiae str. MMD4847]
MYFLKKTFESYKRILLEMPDKSVSSVLKSHVFGYDPVKRRARKNPSQMIRIFDCL